MKQKAPAKKASKGGRKISQVKKSNIKRNKMVKQGKAKPNSQPRYIPNQSKKNKDNLDQPQQPQLTTAEQKEKAAETDKLRDEALDELAEDLPQEERDFINRMNRKRKKGGVEEEEEEELENMEEGAVNRYHNEQQGVKKVKAMLPIKTKDGLKERHIELEENADEEEEEEVPQPKVAKALTAKQVAEAEDGINPGDEVSLVELYAKRKMLLREKKLVIGSLASGFLELPEERIMNLEKVVKLVDTEQHTLIEMSVQRLAAASVLEVLKDVTPGYKIFHQDTGEKLKKETLRLQKYESGLLKCYKVYLTKLERRINVFKKSIKVKDQLELKQSEFFLSCMCQLLVAHPHFNFALNILHAIVPILTSYNTTARTIVKKALEEVFKGDMRGEISMEACRLINNLVKSRKHNVRTEVVDVLKALRIKNVNLDKEKEQEISTKKKEARKQKLLEKNNISRQEKKRKKKLELLERELLESKGEEGRKVKEKFFTEATKTVFTIYFRVLKSFPRSKLMGSVLEGLSKFAHVINLEFFSDLILVFQSLLQSDFLEHRDNLLVVSTVFTILSGQGEALNIDPASFYIHLYNNLFLLEPIRTHGDVPIALKALSDMLIKRRKRISKTRVLAFAKRLGTLSLQLLHHGSAACLGLLRQLINTHSATLQLLDSEHEVGSGVFDPSIKDPEHSSPSNTTAWELALLHHHYHAPTARLSMHIAAQCPVAGEFSLSQEMKTNSEELFSIFSMEEMSFNPSIKPPGGKKKVKRSTTSTITTSLDGIKCSDTLDFFSAIAATDQ